MQLPERPASLREAAVAAWSEPVVIDTYELPPPDRNPLFLEHRVYQGSSGRVYPNPVTDRLSDEHSPLEWDALHLENEYLRVMVLPQIGGRIHVVQDRATGYDLVYRQNVIKPALVGLLGPWISGGIELNWPQHHRPSTYMPVDWRIEQLPDGGAVVWCSEHEPMERMKGMHGVTLRPGSALLELAVRLTNRSLLKQTFLWWANLAARVHDEYEAFFPPDVTYVADHAKRAIATFPVARGRYYGVDYGARPAAEADLRWYRNIPVPTSYMAMGTRENFFGGYDHAADEGFVHWADHTISPGKKLWTWGNHAFGYAWDRELTDADGPYVELMAGVFTDNQPDFSFLMPGEVRTFRQWWYPIRAIGPAHAATLDAAVHLESRDGRIEAGVAVTRARRGVRVLVDSPAGPLLDRALELAPDVPFTDADLALPAGTPLEALRIVVEHEGEELVSYQPKHIDPGEPPLQATEPPSPADLRTNEEIYLTGLHLAQYRHATRRPEDYWGELLRRDPSDSRAGTAMGEWHLRRGELDAAEQHLRRAIGRLTIRNPNPRHGESHYLLGLVLQLRGDLVGADDAFGKAGWDGSFQAAADTSRAEIASTQGDLPRALELLERALASNAAHPGAIALRLALTRRAGDVARARRLVDEALAADPLDARVLHERALLSGDAAPLPGGAQTALDVAHDEARAGWLDEASDALERALAAGPTPGTEPLLRYTLGWLAERGGDTVAASAQRRAAREAAPDYVFPARLEEIPVLQSAMDADPSDPRAPYYLGNLFYDRRRYSDAIRAWRRAAALDPSFATLHRNLGIGEFNVLRRPASALAAYRRAWRADPEDARVLYELDQLRKRLGHAPTARLRALERQRHVVERRDDLSVEFVTLLNRVARHEEAVEVLQRQRFHPWEGGEGLVSRQWVVAHRELARRALERGDSGLGVALAQATMTYPHNLGEGKHLLTEENEVQLLLGRALRATGEEAEARDWLERAARAQGDLDVPSNDGPYWQALALRELGRDDEATVRLRGLRRSARAGVRAGVRIPYFATSLPTMLLFDDDLSRRAQLESRYVEGLAELGLGRYRAARACFGEVLAARPDQLDAALRLREVGAR